MPGRKTEALLRAVVSVFGGCSIASCATPAPSVQASSTCAVDATCSVTGRLDIFPGAPASGAAITRDDGSCMPVALPPEILKNRAGWDGMSVVVTGPVLQRAGEQVEVTSVRYRDRLLASGMCPPGEMVLYGERVVRLAASPRARH
jgi:hypothetical protein